MEKSDGDLVRLAARGHQEAWEALVRRHSSLVYAVIRAYRVPEAEHADLFQNTFVELYRNLEKLSEVRHLPAWLRKVAANACLRTQQVRRRFAPLEFEETIEDGRLDPEAEAVLAERDVLVRQAVDRLDPRCRDLVDRLFFADEPEPYAEVAARMGLASGSVSMIRQRCLDKLEKALRAAGVSG